MKKSTQTGMSSRHRWCFHSVEPAPVSTTVTFLVRVEKEPAHLIRAQCHFLLFFNEMINDALCYSTHFTANPRMYKY